MAAAIRRLAIRGAPLIGVAGAYGLALELVGADAPSAELARDAAERLKGARPTAVNLAWAVDRVLGAALACDLGELVTASLAEARRIHRGEEAASEAIARLGAEWLGGSARRVMTHCNTGSLAAPGEGTALAVVGELFRRGQLDRVVACEARPLLQGARLTAWELAKLGIPFELIVDAAAAGLIAGGGVDAVIVGCDRIAANGDVVN